MKKTISILLVLLSVGTLLFFYITNRFENDMCRVFDGFEFGLVVFGMSILGLSCCVCLYIVFRVIADVFTNGIKLPKISFKKETFDLFIYGVRSVTWRESLKFLGYLLIILFGLAIVVGCVVGILVGYHFIKSMYC